jgi:integrase
LSRVGYWRFHKYKRHAVERDVEEFVGWDVLLEMIEKARARDAAFASIAFETGGRVSEVRMLHRNNFVLTNPKVILVRKMRVLKRFHRERDPQTGEKRVVLDVVFRKTFPIRRDEPLVDIMVEWIEKHDGYLFPTNRGNEPYLGRTMAYKIARKLGSSIGQWIYPHWFRAQRASQLHLEYGFDTIDLMEFFSMEDAKTATRYAKMGWRGLAEKMGIK